MEQVLNEEFFAEFSKKAEKKLKVLWPSKGSTAPAEATIVTTFVNLFDERNYTTFTEVPCTLNGRDAWIDFLAINEEKTEMVLFEAKSDKSSVLKEMKEDWDRLVEFSLSDLYDNNAEINKVSKITKHICVGFWSEHKDKKILKETFKPDIEHDGMFCNWIDFEEGDGIGSKFFCKTI